MSVSPKPLWVPPVEYWKGSDAFIIGGGPSLTGFPWEVLRGRHTIGCNSAFTLGPAVCEVCFFSDLKWFETFRDELIQFPGMIVTHCFDLHQVNWIRTMAMEDNGLHRAALGYGYNSGCSAVNLALILGARRVFLLGVDGKRGNIGQPNWHDRVIDPPSDEVYERFLEGYQKIAKDLPLIFPGREIYNLNPDSAVDCFPKLDPSAILPIKQISHVHSSLN